MNYINDVNDRRSVASSNAPRNSVRQSAMQQARQSILPNPGRSSLMSTRQSLMSSRHSMLANGRLSMISGRASMLPNGRLSAVPLASGRIKQQRQAKTQERDVHDRAKAANLPVPPYDFLELIGKGSFGRVFKSRRKDDRSLVALKIIEVDKSDYEAAVEQRDGAINDFFSEISILQTLKDAQARNVNLIHEAFNFHSQLWIVSDYCPGGSVHTLMKALSEPGLEERFIIAIARELAIALKHIHEVGVIHRDVKAANVLITEHGQLQLCDFGVAGVLESNRSKRHTMIGTPFWMPPEMYDGNSDVAGYGKEVDCWAYGCTVYELATGVPPNFGIAPNKLHLFLTKAPRLDDEKYPKALRDFVAFCLEAQPNKRPVADAITKHSYVANTNIEYPTSMLRELIENYALWEQSGGERASLFNPNMGAQGPEALRRLGAAESAMEYDDEWNFSTTEEFYEDLAEEIELVQRIQNGDEEPTEAEEMNNMSTAERAELEMRARRGERQMGRLFDPNGRPYEYNPQYNEEDFEFDRQLEAAKGRESVIDLDLDMDMDMPTIEYGEDVRASRIGHTPFFIDEEEDEEDDPYKRDDARQEKRSTMGWTFPSNDTEEKRKTAEWSFPGEPTDSPVPALEEHQAQTWTFPGSSDASASERRNTMEWSFAAAEPAPNRRTMEWSFESAGPVEESRSADQSLLASPKVSMDFQSPGRPQLKHSVTAPTGDRLLHGSRDKFGLNTEPEIDLTIDEEPPNDVEIDPTYYSRPSTGYASTADESFLSSTSDIDDPFRYEEHSTIRKSRAPAFREISNQLDQQRSSLHGHSQSEPNRSSQPELDDLDLHASKRSSHTRGSSYNTDQQSQLSRAPSVKASIDSLRVESDDEDDESSSSVVPRKPFLTVPLRRMTNQSPSGTTTTNTSSSISFETGTIKRTRTLPASMLNGASEPKFRGRIRTREQLPRVQAAPLPKMHGADAAALEEEAGQEVVVDELQRLFGQLNTGIRLTGSVLGSVRKRSTSSRRIWPDGTTRVR